MRRRSKLISLILISFLFVMPYFALFQSNIALLANSSDFNLGIMADPVEIDGNYWLEQNASRGNGIEGDPYIIEDLVIDLNSVNEHGIFINNTDAHFQIENCTIIGGESSYSAIYFNNVTNGTIQNNTFDDNIQAITLYQSNQSIIKDNMLIDNIDGNYRGIKLENCENNQLINNTLLGCRNTGVSFSKVNHTLVINNTINDTLGTNWAANIWISNHNTFYNNTISYNHHGIYVHQLSFTSTTNNSFINNTLINNFWGIELENQTHCLLINNTANDDNHYGFHITTGFNHTIIDNNFNDCTEGIRLSGSNNNTINNNTFYDNSVGGIYMLSTSNNNTIFNNTFNKGGLQVSTSSFQEILNNSFSDGSLIQLSGSNNDTILYNDVKNASWHGLGMSGSDNNTIRFNDFTNNTCDGIFLSNCENNLIMQNNLTYNSICGINLTSSLFNMVFINELNNNTGGGVFLTDSSNNTFVNTFASNSTAHGIYLASNSNNNTFRNANACNNSMNGIYLESNCHNNSFDNVNAISNGKNGVELYSNCDDNVFYNHTINNNSESGILLSSNCDNNTFYDDFINFNGENGIHMITCNNNSIYNNTVQNNENGIYLATSSQDNYFFNNTVKFNNYQGFCLNSSCHSNEILNNTSNNNTYIGVYLESSNTNTVKWNSLFGNYQCVSEVSCTGNVIEDNYCQDRPPGQDLPIIIENDADFNTHKSQGTGIEGDPFIIEDKIIDAKYLGNPGIFINNTDAFFIIQNCTLFNADGTLAGIYLENVTHGMIENNTMMYNYDGIRAFNATNNTIFNNTINYNEQNGIFLDNSSLFTIEACIMFDNIDYGLYFYESDNNTIRNNTVDDNFHGIFIDGTASQACINNWILNNTFISNNQHGIYLDRTHNSTISNNTINGNGQHGIYTLLSNFNNITYNIANFNDNNGIYASNGNYNYLLNNTANNQYDESGIRIHNSINITAINSTTNHNDDYGLLVYGSSNVTLHENTACNNSIGLQIQITVTSDFYNNTLNNNSDVGIKIRNDANNNTVHDNFILDNALYGIEFYYECLDNEIYNNTLQNSTLGVYMDHLCENNTFYNNSIQNNTQDGVFIEDCDFNNVTDNEINYNGGYGVVLESSDNCQVINNDLKENGLFPCILQNGTSVGNTITPNTCNPTGPMTEPLPIANVSYTVFLNWTVLSWADYYLVYRSTSPIITLSGATLVANVTQPNCSDTSLTTSDTYYYAVIGVNNTTGANSTISTFNAITLTYPSGPTTETLPTTNMSYSVYLNWTMLSWADYYLVYRNTSAITTLTGLTCIANTTTTEHLDLTLNASDTYYYAVIGSNNSLNLNSTISSFNAINLTYPSAPTNVTFPSTSTGSVFLNWTLAPWADRYLIFRGTAPLTGLSSNIMLYILSSGTLIGNVTVNNFTDTITTSGTYYYAVVAVNDTTGINSTALTFGPISVTVPLGGGLPTDGIIGLVLLLVIIGIIGGACASLFVLHKKEKIDLNKWKDKLTGKSADSSESKIPKKTAEKVEPKKEASPAKPKKAAKPTKVKKEAKKIKKAKK